MKRIENKSIRAFKGPLFWPRVLGDAEIESCSFTACSIGFRHSKDFSRRTVVRNVGIKNCTIESNTILGPAQFEDVFLENVTGCDILILGAVYKHVRMKGKFDTMIAHGSETLEMMGQDLVNYWRLCDQYYADCDWALDISEAEFADFSIRTRAVPANLVRRDPVSQVLIKTERIAEGKWRKLNLCGLVQNAFKFWLLEGSEDLIIVAPKRNKELFVEVMADIKLLRAEGIAEPD